MGLMDAFTADARVELKVGELYDILRVAANNEKTAGFLMNAVKCEVPYKYIREVLTGEKEEDNGVRVEISHETLEAVWNEAKKAAAGHTAADAKGKKEPNPDEVLKDCAPENVSCGECPNKEICNLDLEGEDAGKFPECFYDAIADEKGGEGE